MGEKNKKAVHKKKYIKYAFKKIKSRYRKYNKRLFYYETGNRKNHSIIL